MRAAGGPPGDVLIAVSHRQAEHVAVDAPGVSFVSLVVALAGAHSPDGARPEAGPVEVGVLIGS
jgi:hypothetical protein